MGMVGSADEDGVNLLRLLLQHDPEVPVTARAGVGLPRGIEKLLIDVANGDDVLVGDALQVPRRTVVDADGGDVEPVRCRPGPGRRNQGTRGPQRHRRNGRPSQKLTTIQFLHHHNPPLRTRSGGFPTPTLQSLANGHSERPEGGTGKSPLLGVGVFLPPLLLPSARSRHHPTNCGRRLSLRAAAPPSPHLAGSSPGFPRRPKLS